MKPVEYAFTGVTCVPDEVIEIIDPEGVNEIGVNILFGMVVSFDGRYAVLTGLVVRFGKYCRLELAST